MGSGPYRHICISASRHVCMSAWPLSRCFATTVTEIARDIRHTCWIQSGDARVDGSRERDERRLLRRSWWTAGGIKPFRCQPLSAAGFAIWMAMTQRGLPEPGSLVTTPATSCARGLIEWSRTCARLLAATGRGRSGRTHSNVSRAMPYQPVSPNAHEGR